MSELWRKVTAGTYAASFQGHALEVVRNPDFPADSRRYLPLIDGNPADIPKSTLTAAKTAACQRATREIATAPSGTPSRQPAIIDTQFAEVTEQPTASARDQARVTFTITGTVTTADHIAAMTEIRAAFELLRSVARVDCRIIPPDFIDL